MYMRHKPGFSIDIYIIHKWSKTSETSNMLLPTFQLILLDVIVNDSHLPAFYPLAIKPPTLLVPVLVYICYLSSLPNWNAQSTMSGSNITIGIHATCDYYVRV